MSKVRLNLSLEIEKEDLIDALNLFDLEDTNIKEVLEGFISDLTCGVASHGSDERDRAKSYFDRCCYGLGGAETFLKYLISWGSMDSFIDTLEYYDELLEEFGKDDSETAAMCEALIEFYNEYAEQYIRRGRKVPQSEEEAIKEVREWKKNRETFLEGLEEGEENEK